MFEKFHILSEKVYKNLCNQTIKKRQPIQNPNDALDKNVSYTLKPIGQKLYHYIKDNSSRITWDDNGIVSLDNEPTNDHIYDIINSLTNATANWKNSSNKFKSILQAEQVPKTLYLTQQIGPPLVKQSTIIPTPHFTPQVTPINKNLKQTPFWQPMNSTPKGNLTQYKTPNVAQYKTRKVQPSTDSESEEEEPSIYNSLQHSGNDPLNQTPNANPGALDTTLIVNRSDPNQSVNQSFALNPNVALTQSPPINQSGPLNQSVEQPESKQKVKSLNRHAIVDNLITLRRSARERKKPKRYTGYGKRKRKIEWLPYP